MLQLMNLHIMKLAERPGHAGDCPLAPTLPRSCVHHERKLTSLQRSAHRSCILLKLLKVGVRKGIDMQGVDLPEMPHVIGTPVARSNRTLRASHAPRARYLAPTLCTRAAAAPPACNGGVCSSAGRVCPRPVFCGAPCSRALTPGGLEIAKWTPLLASCIRALPSLAKSCKI